MTLAKAHESFFSRIQQALDDSKAGYSLAVLALALDGPCPAPLGSPEAENFFQDLGYAIKRRLGSMDTVTRLEGPCFGIVMPRLTDMAELLALMPKLQEAAMRMRGQASMGLSVGIALGPRDCREPAGLWERAQKGLEQARLNGGSCAQFSDPDLHASLLESMAMDVSLRLALKRGEFTLAYQPVQALDGAPCASAEALLRWNRAGSEAASPAQFIPAAEACGMITEIGDWVIRQAISDLGRLKAWGFEDFRIAVNVSPRQFAEPGLLWAVRRGLSEYGVDPACLGIEVTESCAVRDMDYACRVLQELRQYGVTVLMDDFGSGHSSLSHLRRFPLDVLKLDKAFIDGLATNPQDALIVASVVALAHSLGLKVTAEGVESQEQKDLLMGMGCDFIQGYLFSRPMPFEALRRFLKTASSCAPSFALATA